MEIRFLPVLCSIFMSEIKHKTLRFQQTHLILLKISHKRGSLDIIIFSGTTATRTPCLDLDKFVVLES